ncbi:phiSA1p31-related protein [Embleya sp. NPDC127516]|uniref:phiSA1p31-related protein n=1 Tax=Embleya sp. NPDC127516 TaxID=3363990 RepID=UPI0038290FED
MNTQTVPQISVAQLALARAEAEYGDLDAGSRPGTLTLADYVERAVTTLTHPRCAGREYDVTVPLVDACGRCWTCCGWTQRSEPLMRTDGPSYGAPIPLVSVIAAYGPLHPTA